MTTFQIVALYVAFNMLLAVVLMIRVARVRLKEKINLGDGGNALMFSRVRAHGNFTENAPLALLGLVGLAMLGANAIALHIFGAAFLIGRILHAMGMAGTFGQGRLFGTLLTMLVYIGQALLIFFLIATFKVN